MKHKCEICGTSYMWKHDLKRHERQKHAAETLRYIVQGSMKDKYNKALDEKDLGNHIIMDTQGDNTNFSMKHPFTMTIAAPTGGGKTYFVKTLLENREKWIHPSPQRIIWLYGQWQPLYEQMKQTIPGIEFVKGIPWNIDEDSFLNSKLRNLIVIDDLMTDATKDNKICNLFTKGSHHRNLSVICLLHNLYYYGKENRTMSLNTHYFVLFKNPRDQQQVMSLARQMYPGNTRRFMTIYKIATDKPYGNLIIDLKPETPDAERFQANVLESTSDNGSQIEEPVRVQYQRQQPGVKFVAEVTAETNQLKHILDELRQLREEVNRNTLPPCQHCGAYYATWKDLYRHLQKNCPMNSHQDT